jgi:hypothetical protein
MSVYHFENNQLVKVEGEVQELLDKHDGSLEKLFNESGWYEHEEHEGVYTLYIPEGSMTVDNILYGYAYALWIEDFASSYPWVMLIGDDLNEYFAAMKLLEPLFTKATFLNGSLEA